MPDPDKKMADGFEDAPGTYRGDLINKKNPEGIQGPILCALAARAPYFYNGSAASLQAVIDFYDARPGIGLSPSDKEDLAAFLRSL